MIRQINRGVRGGYSTLVLTRGDETSVYDFDRELVMRKKGGDVRIFDGPSCFTQAVEYLRTGSENDTDKKGIGEQLYRMGSMGSVRSFKIGDLQVLSGHDITNLINFHRRML